MPTDNLNRLQLFLEAEIERAWREQPPMVNFRPSLVALDDPRPKKIEVTDRYVMVVASSGEYVYLPTSPWVVDATFPILEVVAAEDRGVGSAWAELKVSEKIREYEQMCFRCRYASELRHVPTKRVRNGESLIGWRKRFFAVAVAPGTVPVREAPR